ncbi:MAG: Crp/Fnr family transcriptional regulator [Myxococcota bacterium]
MCAQRPPSNLCPVAAHVALREACLECQGRPSTGQRQLERGDVVVRQGDVARHLFAVVSGWLRESVYDDEGRALSARMVGPGHVLGTSALARAGTLAVTPRYAATIDVLTPARVCFVTADHTGQWLARHPPHAVDLVVAMAKELDAGHRDLALHAQPAEERVLALVRELVASAPDPSAWYRLPATREQLGEVLGLTLETVSRMLHRLARRGVLEIRGREVRLIAHKTPGA